MEPTFESLRKVQLLEKTNASLVELDNEFYSLNVEALANKFASLKENFSLNEARVCENTLKILKDVIERREQKIVLKALRDAKEDKGENSNAVFGLTSEEKELYFNILNLIKQHSSKVDAITAISRGTTSAETSVAKENAASASENEGRRSVVEETKTVEYNRLTQHAGETKVEDKSASDMARVKMLVDLPGFLGHDRKPIGPFRAMQVVQLHENDAAILLKRGAAEEIKA